jgi:hypothetical protein
MPCDGGNVTVWSQWHRAALAERWDRTATLAKMMLRDLRALERVLVLEVKRRALDIHPTAKAGGIQRVI